jgi:small subunit ribosomal protein S20
MANIKSAKKNIRIIDRRTAINKSRKSKIKTYLRKVQDAVNEGNVETAKKSLVDFESKIMKGVSKGVYKKNTASRKVKNLAQKIKNINNK